MTDCFPGNIVEQAERMCRCGNALRQHQRDCLACHARSQAKYRDRLKKRREAEHRAYLAKIAEGLRT